MLIDGIGMCLYAQTMRQMFNIEQGIDPRQVKLPKRMLGMPSLQQGPFKGKQMKDREKFKSCYWRLIGCWSWRCNNMSEKKYSVFDFGLCVNCHVCAQACPVSAITLNVNGVDEYHNLYPAVDKDCCISCEVCERSCPIEAIDLA